MAQYGKKKKGWFVRFYLDDTNDQGQKKRVYLYPFDTKKQAEVGMHKYLDEYNKTNHLIYQDISFKSYAEMWFDNYATIKTAPNTQKRYKLILINHLIPYFGKMKLKDIKPLMLQNYYTLKLNSLSGTTVLKHHRLLHQMLKHAVGWQIILYNYANSVQAPKSSTQETKCLTEKQFYCILDYLNKNSPEYLIPALLAGTTGMRRGEICGLQAHNILLDKQLIYVKDNLQYYNKQWNLTNTKTHRSKRPIYLFDDVIPILKKYVMHQKKIQLKLGKYYINNNYFCKKYDGSFINPNTYTRKIKKAILDLGYDPTITQHGLRHTHASILFSHEKNTKIISQRLGHSTTDITNDIYIHMEVETQKKMLQDITLSGLKKYI